MFHKRRNTILSVILVFLLLWSPQVALASNDAVTPANQTTGSITLYAQSESTDAYASIKQIADKKAALLTSVYGATSLQYALIDHGVIVLSGQVGVNNKATKEAPTADQMYGIGSISKIFTTVAVMQLAEEGKVDLDTPVIQYLPEFRMMDSRYQNITVRMLLNHSSGLMGSTLRDSVLFHDSDENSRLNFLDTLRFSRLKADPGAFSVYSNDGFTLAELLVEKVSGQSFTDYIKDHITTPLSMNHTKTPYDVIEDNQLVNTYKIGFQDPLPQENFNAVGAGGIYSTAKDLCSFADIFMKNYSDVLSQASVKAMENAEYKNGIWPAGNDPSLVAYGLGWDNVNTYPYGDYGIKALVKGGDTLVYHGNITVLPEENMAMVVLSSGGVSTYDQMLSQVVLLEALKAKGIIHEILPDKTFEKPVAATMPEELKKQEGYYASFSFFMKAAISDDGILTLSDAYASSTSQSKYTYTGDGKFYSGDGSSYVSFVEERNGNTYLYLSSYTLLPSLGQLADSGYQLQKLSANPLSDEVKAAWEKRDGKKYFLVNEKYTSGIYVLRSPITQFPLIKDYEGYTGNMKIIDQNHAEANLEIPGVGGRDLNDLFFYTIGGKDYMITNGYNYISEDNITSLSKKSGSTLTIDSTGFSKWYRIEKDTAKKKLKVKMPKYASFSVYDASTTCIYNSVANHEAEVTLPKEGYIVFCGDPNTEFTLQYPER